VLGASVSGELAVLHTDRSILRTAEALVELNYLIHARERPRVLTYDMNISRARSAMEFCVTLNGEHAIDKEGRSAVRLSPSAYTSRHAAQHRHSEISARTGRTIAAPTGLRS